MRKILYKLFRIARALVLLFFVSSILITILYIWVPPVITPLMLIRAGEHVANGEFPKIKKDWTSIENISPHMVQAVVASEDNRFVEHFGFDFKAIEKARKLNKKGRKLRGASTISQQTAKNVFLWPQRSYLRKGLEVYFTLLIEVFWSKERIMEVYLNVIEMGNGIYGAQKASEIYFKKPCDKLSKQQAALIAATIPNPRKWRPDKPTNYILKRQNWILWNMKNIGPVKLDE